MEGSADTWRPLILTLRFERTSEEAPRPEQIAGVLEDAEGLYPISASKVGFHRFRGTG